MIVDTPGLGESDVMDEVLMNYLPNAFAFIYVIDLTRAGGLQQDFKYKVSSKVLNDLSVASTLYIVKFQSIGRLQLAAILVYFPKQAKSTFVIHGDIGSETTKLYMIWCNVSYNQAKYRKLTVNFLAGTAIINLYKPRWRLIASSDVMCKRPISRNTRSKLMHVLFHLVMFIFIFLFLIRFSSGKQT